MKEILTTPGRFKIIYDNSTVFNYEVIRRGKPPYYYICLRDKNKEKAVGYLYPTDEDVSSYVDEDDLSLRIVRYILRKDALPPRTTFVNIVPLSDAICMASDLRNNIINNTYLNETERYFMTASLDAIIERLKR